MKINIFDKDFNIAKLVKVGDLVAAFIMKLHESSARYNGENFYILKSDLELYKQIYNLFNLNNYFIKCNYYKFIFTQFKMFLKFLK